MILVDSSAWIEYLRATDSPTDERLTHLLLSGGELLATTDVVLMEVLAGARDEAELRALRRLLGAAEFLAVEGPADYEAAAALHRRCRRGGETPRSLSDCLIAAVALRANAQLLHADRDFELIARHTTLVLA